ncbi:hypothetical protein GDO78_008625 [Eleutherodactylus coqui]|uniref:Uncharacterized protein n=1 Tax=Eleutherodactylus coqui TaxID=57060 RepID=A0A8J6FEN8_ELECQ|nr:hypothetical protein GDO78_008625 [Eleutherodactylus coqui]
MGTSLYILWLFTLNLYLTSGYEGSGYSPLEDDEDAAYARSRYRYGGECFAYTAC